MIGRTLAHYTITAKIGEGGMGEVYRARDTKLDRDVALKVLPAVVATDADRLARFQREAKSVAALNHPNIVTLFSVEEAEGIHLLIMELVEGQSLDRLLPKQGLPLSELLRITISLSDALEAAHAAGIVHRDLKPSNVMLTNQGRVKVLDFGLAKAVTEKLSETDETLAMSAEPLTSAGMVLGTVPYMSPEQVTGLIVDARADIWSFGCILWEGLTGKSLFGRATPSESIGAILHTEPDWSKLPQDVPANVRRVLRRCLVKDAGQRLHHIADARIELTEIDDTTGESAPGRFLSDQSRSLKRYQTGTFLLLFALIITLAASLGRRYGFLGGPGSTTTYENPLAGAKFTRLTNFPGDEFDAAISPDGRFVAFASDRDGPFDILVGQIDSQEFRNVTRRRASDRRDMWAPVRKVGFNADGSEIWFGGGTGRRLQMTALLGGSPRHFLGETAVNVEWSRDGRRIVYHLSDPGDPLYVADYNGANSHLILSSEEGNHQHFPIWSPDGAWIYVVRGRPITGEMDLWRLRPDGSGLQRLTENKRKVVHPAPINEHTVLYCAQEPDGAGPWLWVLNVETGRSSRVTYGTENYTSVSVSEDGSRAVATVSNPRAELWRVPILNHPATEADVEPVSVPSMRAMAPRFGGEQLFYLSSRGAGDGLWRYHNGESKEIWKGSKTPLLEPPAVSPDGSRVALVLRQNGQQVLHILSADGAELHRLTDQVDARGGASWSPDGDWLVVGGSSEGSQGLFKIPVAGGSPERIVSGEALNPVWSPKGDLIVYTGAQVQAVCPLRVVRPDGIPVELPPIEVLREHGGQRVRFLPNGEGLVYMEGLSSTQDFVLLDLATMESRRLTRFEDPASMRTFDITPDGTEIVFDRLRQGSDLVLIDLNDGGD